MINIKIGDEKDYAVINATNVDELHKLIDFLNSSFGVNNSKPYKNLKPYAVLSEYNKVQTVKVGPIVFSDGKIGYFHTPVSNSRDRLKWREAFEYCESMGFFLPNKEQLELLIKYKDLIDDCDNAKVNRKFKDLENDWFWSSDESNAEEAWIQNPSGTTSHSFKYINRWAIAFKRVTD